MNCGVWVFGIWCGVWVLGIWWCCVGIRYLVWCVCIWYNMMIYCFLLFFRLKLIGKGLGGHNEDNRDSWKRQGHDDDDHPSGGQRDGK